MAKFFFLAQAVQVLEVNAENEQAAREFMNNQSENNIQALVARHGGWELLDDPELVEQFDEV